MAIICASCDRVPAPDAATGAPCAACGMPLVAVREPDELTGEIIDGRFEILGVIAAGGMGTIYRARQRSIGREVALKLIDRSQDAAAAKRFFREAQLASQLSHPNVVGVIDFGQSGDGRLYLAMELLRGKTLRDLLAGGPLPASRIARIASQLVDALEAAHEAGIVHRDLKLDNVMVVDGARELVKVLDFGLALSPTAERATATGVIAGTPMYMAPEVFGGEPAAPAQDLYALGVILGELATGRALWQVSNIAHLVTTKLDPVHLDGVDPALAAIVCGLVAGEPAARPSLADVRAGLATVGDTAPPVPSEPAIRLPSAAFRPGSDVIEPKLELELELDEGWVRERAARQSAPPPSPKRKPSHVGAIVAVVLVVAVAAVVVWLAIRPAKEHVQRPGAVQINVVAKQPVDVRFDGKYAGKTPFTANMPRGTKPIHLAAGAVELEVVPDRDQTIDLDKPR